MNILTNIKQHSKHRSWGATLFIAFIALFFNTSAMAVEWTPIQMEQEIQVKAYKNAYYTLTPTASGTVKLVTTEGIGANSYAVTTTGATSTDGSVETAWSFTDNSLSFQVKADTTYYITLFFPMQDWTFKATMGEEFKLLSISPEDGSTFYITSNNNAAFTFSSSSVTFTEGEVLANGNLIKIYNFDDYNELVSSGIFTYTEEGGSGVVNWNGNLCGHFQESLIVEFTTHTGHGFYNVLNRLVEEGKLNAGDKITLTLHGVKDNLSGKLLNGDGNLEVNWSFAGAPTVLVSQNIPSTIYSWYNEGDLEAIATYTFSREIKSARATLEMGTAAIGVEDYYYEEIPADKITYRGKTIKVDLSGVMRTRKTMNLKYDWPSFSLKLSDVIDIDGNGTLSEDQGTLSSYTFSAKYKDLTTDIATEFTPGSGKALTVDTKTIEIWFNNSDLITWDGVTFTYYTEENGELIAHEVFVKKEDCTVEVESNETVITVKVPDGIYQASNVRVGVNVVSSTDGTDHVIAAYYNTTLSHDFDLAITADPANGSTLSYLKEIYLFLNMPYAINNKIDNPVIVKGQNTGFKCLAHIESAGMMGAKIVLDEHITKADTYIIEIKAGVVGDYVYGESSFKAGTTHDKCTLTYIIDGKYAGKSVLIDPAEGEVKSLKTFNLTYFELAATAPTWDKSATPYIEDAQGAKTYLEFQTQTESTNVVTVELANEITAEGRYKLVIPSGAVCNGSTGDPLTEELSFNYTVNPNLPDAITDITLQNNNANVYTIAGQLVKKGAKATDIKQLPASLYIVNGKKVVVK